MNAQHLPRVLLTVVISFLLGIAAHASSVLFVGIDSSSGAPHYTVNHQPMTLTELGRWFVSVRETFGANLPTFLKPDDATTAATIAGVLNTLRRAGVHQPFLDIPSESGIADPTYWVFQLGPPRLPAGTFTLRLATDNDFRQ